MGQGLVSAASCGAMVAVMLQPQVSPCCSFQFSQGGEGLIVLFCSQTAMTLITALFGILGGLLVGSGSFFPLLLQMAVVK